MYVLYCTVEIELRTRSGSVHYCGSSGGSSSSGSSSSSGDSSGGSPVVYCILYGLSLPCLGTGLTNSPWGEKVKSVKGCGYISVLVVGWWAGGWV